MHLLQFLELNSIINGPEKSPFKKVLHWLLVFFIWLILVPSTYLIKLLEDHRRQCLTPYHQPHTRRYMFSSLHQLFGNNFKTKNFLFGNCPVVGSLQPMTWFCLSAPHVPKTTLPTPDRAWIEYIFPLLLGGKILHS